MPNLNDAFGWIENLKREIARLKSGAFLENSSITQGRMRFIGGLLLIDAGGTLQVIGHFNGQGDFIWSGPWKFNSGDGEIAGDVKLTGDFDLTGKFISENIRIEGGKIYVGTGANQIVIDGATGKITAGNMSMDPTVSGGALTFANGAQVFTDDDSVQVFKGNSVVQVTDNYARLQNGGDVVEIDDEGVRMSPGAVPAEDSVEGADWLAIDKISGRLRRINPAFGGPGGGQFEYPFPESTITSGFRPPERPTHNGIDQAGPGVDGELIPAAAAGVVTFAGGVAEDTPTNGYGYHVIINHGTINGRVVETLYAHMATPPLVASGEVVQKRQPLGPVGQTGRSQGIHLHWEIHVDGNPVDPTVFMADYS